MLSRDGGSVGNPPSRRLQVFLAVVALAVIVRPFPAARSDGAALWSTLQLTDAIAQVKAGAFPVYVGQTEAVPDGTPYAGAPVRPWAGVALHFLTFGLCAPAGLDWLIASGAALGGVCAAYLGLGAVLPNNHWLRLLLAATYVLACGLLWQLGRCSETAFVAVPFVPLLFSALVRGARRPDARAAGSTATLLALLWMSHPPTGLVATLLAAAGGAVWTVGHGRRALRPVLGTAVLFGLLSAWFFAGAGPLGVFPIRAAWLTDQCAVPAAALCATAALGLRRLLATDGWEVTLVVVDPSGATDQLGRLGGNAALAGLGLCAAALAAVLVLLAQRPAAGPDPSRTVAAARAEPRALLPVPPDTARPDRFSATDDPILRNYLIRSSGAVRNEDAVPFRDDRPGSAVPQPLSPKGDYVPVRSRDVRPILHFEAGPDRRYVLTLGYRAKNYRGGIRIDGATGSRTTPLPEDSDGLRMLRLLVCDASPRSQVIELALVGQVTSDAPDSGASCAVIGLSAYRPEELPVQVSSLAPYAAVVTVDGAQGFLVTHRRFVPGYRALVNGAPADPFRSADGMLAVAVPPGTNEVRLRYAGTAAMRGGFVVSAMTALGLAAAAARSGWRRRGAAERAAQQGAGSERAVPPRRAA